MKKLICLLLTACFSLAAAAQPKPADTEVWGPEPVKVTGVIGRSPPSDAIVLFDGSNTDAWQHEDGRPLEWTVAGDVLMVKPGQGMILTKQNFGDVQLHLEWRTPYEVTSDNQGPGNSGVFFQNRYEVQVLDTYENKTYVNGQAGSIYKQTPPLVNASAPSGSWQSYDIIFKAPVFSTTGERLSPGYVTVLHNGVLVQNHTEILGTTEFIGPPLNIAHGKAPLQLQDHGELVSYRNIWIREL